MTLVNRAIRRAYARARFCQAPREYARSTGARLYSLARSLDGDGKQRRRHRIEPAADVC